MTGSWLRVYAWLAIAVFALVKHADPAFTMGALILARIELSDVPR